MFGHQVLRREQRLPGSPEAVFPFFGPYRLWHHTHEFRAHPHGGTVMTDTVLYALPYEPLAALAHRVLVRRDVERSFDYRAQAVPALVIRR